MGGVMELVGNRKGELVRMDNREGQVHLEFTIPARGLIGLRTRMLTATQGDGDHAPQLPRIRPRAATSPAAQRRDDQHGHGNVNAYALNNLQDRGVMFVEPPARNGLRRPDRRRERRDNDMSSTRRRQEADQHAHDQQR
jgi:GTP-binding protein